MNKLVVAGTGILGIGHITLQTLGYIKSASVVFSVIADPITDYFVHENAKDYRPLHGLYQVGQDRQPVYDAMVDVVMKSLLEHDLVCVLFYGHPGVFVNPSRRMIREALAAGHDAEMLPGISAEDCLFADLDLDPAVAGCQTFEATDFLLNKRDADVTVPLILLQIGVVGDSTFEPTRIRAPNLDVLMDALAAKYELSHEIVLYEASPFVVAPPRIERLPLSSLPCAQISGLTTLLVPALESRAPDPEMAARLRRIRMTTTADV